MWLTLISKFWPAIPGAIAAFILSFCLHVISVDRLKLSQAAALKAQSDKLIAQCNNDKAITEGVSHDLQTKLSNLSNQLATLKRMRPAVCVPVIANTTSGYDAAPGTGQHGGQNGLRSEWLYDYAGEAEKYRLQLISCQGFIKEVWSESGR